MDPESQEYKSQRARVESFFKTPLTDETIRLICDMGTIQAQLHVHQALLRCIGIELQPAALRATVDTVRIGYNVKRHEVREHVEWNDVRQLGFNEAMSRWARHHVRTQIEKSWSDELGKHMLMVDTEISTAIFPQVKAWVRGFEHAMEQQHAKSSNPLTPPSST